MNQNSRPFKELIDTALLIIEAHLEENLESVWLFGSLARGEGKCTSDIDLLINLNGEYPDRWDRGLIYNDLDSLVERDLMFSVVFCKNRIVESYSPIFNREVMKDKVLLKEYDHSKLKTSPQIKITRMPNPFKN